MMSPTVVLRDGRAELAVGSAGSNRIRSAILQTIMRSIDDGLPAQEAVDAPRLHYEDGIVYTEPGIDAEALEAAGLAAGPVPRAQPVLRRCPGGGAGPGRRLLRRRRPAPRRRGDRRGAAVTGAGRSPVGAAGPGGGPRAVLAHRRGRLRARRPVAGPVPAHPDRTGHEADPAGQRLRHDPLQRRQGQDDLQRAADPGPRPGRQPGQRRQGRPRPARRTPDTVFSYRIRMQQGTIASPTATPCTTRSSPRPSCSPPRRPRARAV